MNSPRPTAMLPIRSLFLALLACLALVSAQRQAYGPCRDTFCPRGGVCTPYVEGDRSYTTCECPTSCPDLDDPVCSIFNQEFKNACEMHKYACKLQMSMAIKNAGACVKPTDPKMMGMTDCPKWMLEQFPYRFLDWLYLTRELSRDPRFEIAKRGEQLTGDEIKEVLAWEFNNWDLNKNGIWDKEELDLVQTILMPIEGCSFGFLKSCDLDGKGDMDRREWMMCFPEGVIDISTGSRRH
ncbi:SPARC isoform X2 [Nematostella vectensis]|nr:SPARC isoform X2 [Nematostella vectensis]